MFRKHSGLWKMGPILPWLRKEWAQRTTGLRSAVPEGQCWHRHKKWLLSDPSRVLNGLCQGLGGPLNFWDRGEDTDCWCVHWQTESFTSSSPLLLLFFTSSSPLHSHVCLQPAWPGDPSPAAWPPPSPPSTPTPRPWSSSDTSASCLSRACARSRTTWTRRPSTTSGTGPSSPSPALWRSTLATVGPEPGLLSRVPVLDQVPVLVLDGVVWEPRRPP